MTPHPPPKNNKTKKKGKKKKVGYYISLTKYEHCPVYLVFATPVFIVCILFNRVLVALTRTFINFLNYLFVILQECPVGTYKNVTGSDKSLCHQCPPQELPHRAVYISVRGISSFSQYLCYILKSLWMVVHYRKHGGSHGYLFNT